MPGYSLPRYFVRHAATNAAADIDDGALPLHLIDGFFVGDRHLQEREWFVAVDELGNLRVLSGDERESFSAALQTELAFNEISRNRSARLIEASEVFLFDLQFVEQIADAPGWNDPVYLYGTLFAPPLPANSGARAAGIKGQLTVTRGDLLDGIVRSSENAFRGGGAGGIGGKLSLCFHLMLPGGTDEEIRRGAAIVLAYPLFPAELLAATGDAANEIVVSQMLYDLLSALKKDFERERITHPLCSTVLPVVNRLTLERELKAQGYEIEGDTAYKKNDSGEGFKGFLASVFGAFSGDDLALPPEGDADDFLRLAKQTVDHLPNDFPSARISALRNRLKSAPARLPVQSPRAPTPPIKTPAPPNTPPTPLKVASVGVKKTVVPDYDPPAWMRDFIQAHRQADAPPPVLNSLSQPNPPIISAAKNNSKTRKKRQQQQQREWEKDFAAPAAIESKSKSGQGEKKQSPSEPDWMKDFE